MFASTLVANRLTMAGISNTRKSGRWFVGNFSLWERGTKKRWRLKRLPVVRTLVYSVIDQIEHSWIEAERQVGRSYLDVLMAVGSRTDPR